MPRPTRASGFPEMTAQDISRPAIPAFRSRIRSGRMGQLLASPVALTCAIVLIVLVLVALIGAPLAETIANKQNRPPTIQNMLLVLAFAGSTGAIDSSGGAFSE